MNKTLASIITAAGIVIGSSGCLTGCNNNPIRTGGSESSYVYPVYSRKSQADCEFGETAQISSCYERLIARTKMCLDNLMAPLGGYDKDLNARCAEINVDEELKSCRQNAHNKYQQCIEGEQK